MDICEYINNKKEFINHYNKANDNVKKYIIFQSINIIKDKILGNKEIAKQVLDYVYPRTIKMKLLDWIPLDKLNWYNLSMNPNAYDLLIQNKDKIDHESLVNNQNCKTLDLLDLTKLDKDDLEVLNTNPNAIELLQKNPSKINYKFLSENENALELLEKNMKKIN